MIRPHAAAWFEILAGRHDAVRLAEALAAGGCAEFEAPEGPAGPAEQMPLAALAQRFRDLERRYGRWWPEFERPVPAEVPSTLLARALARIEAWAVAAEPAIAALVSAETQRARLAPWPALLAAPGFGTEERTALATRRLAAALFRLPPGTELRLPEAILAKSFAAGDERYLLALGAGHAITELAEQVSAGGGRRMEVPGWIAETDAARRARESLRRCEAELAARRERLAALAAGHGLADAVADCRRGCWCLDMHSVEERRALCRITGWTPEPAALRRVLDAARVSALLRFPPPPAGLSAPLLLYNPWWASPYEAFCRLLGMPARDAADPSAVVALVFPLLFGYMFGDVGQGLALSVLGLAFGRRWPLVRLLVPAGLSAALFGVAFGSVFSLHGIVPAMWVEPLSDPLPVLAVPLVAGALLLFIGLLLSALEARWRGQLRAWLASDGAAMLLYAGLLAAGLLPSDLRWPALATAALLAAALALAGGGGLAAAARALAGSIEKTLQLAINTISFVRVGAFAIAHAGLSSAMMLLAEAAGEGPAALLVVVVGNLFIVALEVLVVSVQTTRLLLFEFFTRFFVGSGRSFRAAQPPSLKSSTELHHEP